MPRSTTSSLSLPMTINPSMSTLSPVSTFKRVERLRMAGRWRQSAQFYRWRRCSRMARYSSHRERRPRRCRQTPKPLMKLAEVVFRVANPQLLDQPVIEVAVEQAPVASPPESSDPPGDRQKHRSQSAPGHRRRDRLSLQSRRRHLYGCIPRTGTAECGIGRRIRRDGAVVRVKKEGSFPGIPAEVFPGLNEASSSTLFCPTSPAMTRPLGPSKEKRNGLRRP